MIYRAFDCSVYDSNEQPLTVWFTAANNEDAHSRLTQLLSLAWQVDVDSICIGNVLSEIDMERNSVQPREAGNRRWYESGSRGDFPRYDRSPELVMLPARKVSALIAAKSAAKAHARELASMCLQEMNAMPAGTHRDSEAQRWQQDRLDYLRFADGVVGYDI